MELKFIRAYVQRNLCTTLCKTDEVYFVYNTANMQYYKQSVKREDEILIHFLLSAYRPKVKVPVRT